MLSTATNVKTGSTGLPGTAAITKITVLNKGVTSSESASLYFNDGDGISMNIPFQTTGLTSYAGNSPDGNKIRTTLGGISTITDKYTIESYNPDEIVITQKNNTGDVTITVTLSATHTPIVASKHVVGVAAVSGTKDQDKFTVMNTATSNGYIVVSISDDTGMAPTEVTVAGITTLDTKAAIATKIANALNASSVINAKYTVTASGDDVELETKTIGPNNLTINLQ